MIAAATTKRRTRGGVLLLLLIVLAVYGVEAHARRKAVATPAMHADQAAYLAYARAMHDTHYSYIGTRNRMPAFPFLLSLVYRPGLDDAEFLRRAQTFNVNLSILLLALLYWIFRRFLRPYLALSLVTISAFGVFVYRAGIAQAELLFYFLSFCAFVLLVRMLVAPGWWLAILTGAALALAYLAKASMLAAVPLWSGVFAIQAIYRTGRAPSWVREAVRAAGLLFLTLAAFLAAVFPYILTNKQVFGEYFYNVNSKFYMWCDSWPEAVAFTEIYNDPVRRTELASDQFPSAAKYWREHSVAQIAQRLISALATMTTRGAKLTGYYKFVAVLAVAAVAVAFRYRADAIRLMQRQAFAAAFCVVFLFVYLLLYAWYGPIVTDSRFVLALFLPFVFAASVFVARVAGRQTVSLRGFDLAVPELVAAILAALALIDAAYNARYLLS